MADTDLFMECEEEELEPWQLIEDDVVDDTGGGMLLSATNNVSTGIKTGVAPSSIGDLQNNEVGKKTMLTVLSSNTTTGGSLLNSGGQPLIVAQNAPGLGSQMAVPPMYTPTAVQVLQDPKTGATSSVSGQPILITTQGFTVKDLRSVQNPVGIVLNVQGGQGTAPYQTKPLTLVPGMWSNGPGAQRSVQQIQPLVPSASPPLGQIQPLSPQGTQYVELLQQSDSNLELVQPLSSPGPPHSELSDRDRGQIQPLSPTALEPEKQQQQNSECVGQALLTGQQQGEGKCQRTRGTRVQKWTNRFAKEQQQDSEAQPLEAEAQQIDTCMSEEQLGREHKEAWHLRMRIGEILAKHPEKFDPQRLLRLAQCVPKRLRNPRPLSLEEHRRQGRERQRAWRLRKRAAEVLAEQVQEHDPQYLHELARCIQKRIEERRRRQRERQRSCRLGKSGPELGKEHSHPAKEAQKSGSLVKERRQLQGSKLQRAYCLRKRLPQIRLQEQDSQRPQNPSSTYHEELPQRVQRSVEQIQSLVPAASLSREQQHCDWSPGQTQPLSPRGPESGERLHDDSPRQHQPPCTQHPESEAQRHNSEHVAREAEENGLLTEDRQQSKSCPASCLQVEKERKEELQHWPPTAQTKQIQKHRRQEHTEAWHLRMRIAKIHAEHPEECDPQRLLRLAQCLPKRVRNPKPLSLEEHRRQGRERQRAWRLRKRAAERVAELVQEHDPQHLHALAQSVQKRVEEERRRQRERQRSCRLRKQMAQLQGKKPLARDPTCAPEPARRSQRSAAVSEEDRRRRRQPMRDSKRACLSRIRASLSAEEQPQPATQFVKSAVGVPQLWSPVTSIRPATNAFPGSVTTVIPATVTIRSTVPPVTQKSPAQTSPTQSHLQPKCLAQPMASPPPSQTHCHVQPQPQPQPRPQLHPHSQPNMLHHSHALQLPNHEHKLVNFLQNTNLIRLKAMETANPEIRPKPEEVVKSSILPPVQITTTTTTAPQIMLKNTLNNTTPFKLPENNMNNGVPIPMDCPKCNIHFNILESLKVHMAYCCPQLLNPTPAKSPQQQPHPAPPPPPPTPPTPPTPQQQPPVKLAVPVQGKLIMLVDDFYYGRDEGSTYQMLHEMKTSTTFRCLSCLKRLKNNIRFMNHMKHHLELEQQNDESIENHTTCQHCFRQYATPFQLQCHIENVHSPYETTTKCKICELAFETEQLFLQHMKDTHKPGEMPYVCQVCEYRSSVYLEVDNHFRMIHEDTKNLLCPYCFKVLKNSSAYQQHYMKHQKKSVYPCNKCRLQFISAKEKMEHKVEHHKTFKKPKQLEGLQPGTKVTIRTSMGQARATGGANQEVPTRKVYPPVLPAKAQDPPACSTVHTVAPVPKPVAKPEKKKVVERMSPLLIDMQEIRKLYSNQVCLECNFDITNINNISNHFPTYVHCSRCRYSTSCSRAYADHMISYHTQRGKPKYLMFGKVKKSGVLLACSSCTFTVDKGDGDEMAQHLDQNQEHGPCRFVTFSVDRRGKASELVEEPALDSESWLATPDSEMEEEESGGVQNSSAEEEGKDESPGPPICQVKNPVIRPQQIKIVRLSTVCSTSYINAKVSSPAPVASSPPVPSTASDHKESSSPVYIAEDKKSSSPVCIAEDKKSSSPVYISEDKKSSSPVYISEDKNSSSPVYISEDKNNSSPVYISEDKNNSSPVYTSESKNSSSPVYISEDKNSSSPVYISEDKNSSSPVYIPEDKNSSNPVYIPEDKNSSNPVYITEDKNNSSPVYITEDKNNSSPVYIAEDKNNSSPVYIAEDKNNLSPVYIEEESELPQGEDDSESQHRDLPARRKSLSEDEFKVVLHTLCCGMQSATEQYHKSRSQVEQWLNECAQHLDLLSVGGDAGAPLLSAEAEEQLVEWVLVQREQQLPLTEETFVQKLFELLGSQGPGLADVCLWAVGFLLRHNLIAYAKITVARKLPREMEENIQSFVEFAQRQIAGRDFPHRMIANMDEIPIFLDPESLQQPEGALGGLGVTGTGQPQFVIIFTILADGKLLPTMVFSRGGLPSWLKVPAGILLEVKETGHSQAEVLKLWLAKVWQKHVAVPYSKSMLVLDGFGQHMSDDFIDDLSRCSSLPLVIPGGCTSRIQPLDMCISQTFRNFLQKRWAEYAREAKCYRDVYGDVLQSLLNWVAEAIEFIGVNADIVEQSFRVASVLPGPNGHPTSVQQKAEVQEELVSFLQEQLELSGKVEECDNMPSVAIDPRLLTKLFEADSDAESFCGFQENDL